MSSPEDEHEVKDYNAKLIMAAWDQLMTDAACESVHAKKAARVWGIVHLTLGLSATVLSAIAGTTGLLAEGGRIPAGIMALVAAASAATLSYLEPGLRQQHQKQHAIEWSLLFEDIRFYRRVHMTEPGWTMDGMKSELAKFRARFESLVRGSSFRPADPTGQIATNAVSQALGNAP